MTRDDGKLIASKTFYITWFGSSIIATIFLVWLVWLISKNIFVTAILGGLLLTVAITKASTAIKGVQMEDGVLRFIDESRGFNGKQTQVKLSDIDFVYLGNRVKFTETTGVESVGSVNFKNSRNTLELALATVGSWTPSQAGARAALLYKNLFFIVTKDQIVYEFNPAPYSKNNCRAFLKSLKANGITTFVKTGLL